MTNIVLFVSDCRYIFDIRSRYNGWLAHSWLLKKNYKYPREKGGLELGRSWQ